MSLPTPTQEQTLAIQTTSRSLIVEAGAGSGKTWVLVERFLHQLETHEDWPLDAIVAITFTEKAAREMRDRIRRAVERRAQDGQPRWQALRLELEQLRVSTIHSLCARILREHAIAVGLDPRFDVLDEDEAGFMKEEAIRRTLALLAQAGEDETLALLESLRVYELREEMASLLGKRGSVERAFADLAAPETLLARWEREIKHMQETAWREICREEPLIGDALEDLPAIPVQAPQDKLAESVQAAAAAAAALTAGDFATAFLQADTIHLGGGKAANWGGTEALKEYKAQLGALRDGLRKLKKQCGVESIGEFDESAAVNLQRWHTLWRSLETAYSTLKQAHHALDFDDLEFYTARLLDQKTEDPRLDFFRKSIRHLMVDEYQDTNALQQAIIFALAPPKEAGRFFAVGDVKQSIYRFRQAQASIFHETTELIRRHTGAEPITLGRSFRSHQSLTAACNDLFDVILQPLDGSSHASFEARPGPLHAPRQLPPDHPAAQRPVEVVLLPANDASGETLSARDARVLEAQILAERLRELYKIELPVWDKDAAPDGGYRPFRYGDAAILFRSTTNLPLYEEQFKQAGLPYLTESGRGYYLRPEVQDLIALLGWLDNPGDELALATALRSPLFALSDETLYRLRRRDESNRLAAEPQPLYAALAAPPPTAQTDDVQFAHAVLTELSEAARRVSVWRLLRMALDRTGYDIALALDDQIGHGGGRQWQNVQKLLAIARERPTDSLSLFLHRVRDLRAAEAREGEALGRSPEGGAVRLMSIHAAKGLEFPVICVADMGRAGGGRGSPHLLTDPEYGLLCKLRDESGDWQKPASYRWGEWIDQRMEEAENKRLLYVACTRAADLLLLSGKPTKNSWLDEVLNAWALAKDGEVGTTASVDHDGYTILVHYAPAQAPPARAKALRADESQAAVEMRPPPLLQPVTLVTDALVTGVTDYAAGVERAGAQGRPIRPAVHTVHETGKPRVSGFVLGNIIHAALRDWSLIGLPRPAQAAALTDLAQRFGLFEPNLRQDAVTRSLWLLQELRGNRLYGQITRARQRHHEAPFSMRWDGRILNGQIDLLYEDEAGQWRLIDWKTEYTTMAEGPQAAARHKLQLALYAVAARRLLDIEVTPTVVFLRPGVQTHTFDSAELTAALNAKRAVNPSA